MPRGPDAKDRTWFGTEAIPTLARAVAELSWLLTRGYALPSALDLVGDRYQLRRRQRAAVGRAAASDASLDGRRQARVDAAAWRARRLLIDGFNVLITTEVGLEGGPVVVGRDGASRDLAGVHGTYRSIRSTRRALGLLLSAAARHEVASCHWFFDRGVSNSGRMAERVRAMMDEAGMDGTAEVVTSPDRILKRRTGIVCTSDGPLLDRVPAWTDLPRHALEGTAIWRVDLRGTHDAGGL